MILFIYCAGGFGKELMEVVRGINSRQNIWEDIYFIDDVIQGDTYYGTKKYTFAEVLEKFPTDSYEVSIASGEPEHRAALYSKLKSHDIKLATIIHDSATIADSAEIGEGAIILNNACVSSLVKVGNNSVLYAYSIAGHETVIKENCFISAGVMISGNVTIGENCFIGLGARIKERITIGKSSFIGMAAAVFKDVPDNYVVVGNPGKRLPKKDGMVF